MPTLPAAAVDDTGAPDRAGPVVRARSVSRRFGSTEVLHDLDLTVPQGSIHALIGPSGSGKTTTVRILTGILAPSEGSVTVFDTDPRQLTTEQRQDIGYMPQLGVLYPELSVNENLRFAASLYGVRKPKQRIAEVLGMLDLGDAGGTRLEHTSGGMQRRVALAAAMLHDPHLLFLDEPTSGLDPVLRQRVWEWLQELRDEGRTVVVTTQIVSEATMCDTVGLIASGRLQADGPPEELRRRAVGGDVVDLHTPELVGTTALEALADRPDVVSAERTGPGGRTVRVVVDDAEQAIADLVPFLADHGVEVRLAERYTTPFDDVFVGLLQLDDTPDEGGTRGA
ncbi:ATP-binding cassette domain-containing protein [Euzebya sp.]|uniref:ATP-binding cassette domain-containing protein n=1 Tax=Euzebya sp. TaxID=1971409 RepID=UPI003516AF3E